MLSLPPLPPTHTVPTPVHSRKEKERIRTCKGRKQLTWGPKHTDDMNSYMGAHSQVNHQHFWSLQTAFCPEDLPRNRLLSWLLTESGGVRHGSECRQLSLPYRSFDGPTDLPMLKPRFSCLLGGTLPLCFMPNVCRFIPTFTFRTELLNHF